MRTVAAIRAVLFVMALVLPLSRTYPKNVPLPFEQRSRAPLPALFTARQQYPEQFDAFVRDNFGARDRMIRWHHLLKFHVFRESPTPDVILGPDHWLFYAALKDGVDIRNFSGRWPHPPSDIDRWFDWQGAREQEYARLGSRYLIAVAPDKQSVYPDLVPLRFGPHAPGVLSELLHGLASHPRLQVLDLTQTLRRAAGESQLYYKIDTHWNDRGAFLAAQAIADRLRQSLPSVPVIREADYVRTESVQAEGDLLNMLALGVRVPDRRVVYQRRTGGARVLMEKDFHKIWLQPDSGLPTAVLIGDSFGASLAPVLADAFSRFHFFVSTMGPPDPDLVRRERPDVVVRLTVERYLLKLTDER
jgi:alginate O-acetyltransferase complex protein AlgJ